MTTLVKIGNLVDHGIERGGNRKIQSLYKQLTREANLVMHIVVLEVRSFLFMLHLIPMIAFYEIWNRTSDTGQYFVELCQNRITSR